MATKFKGIKTAAEYRRGELAKDILRLVGAGLAVSAVGVAVIAAPNTVQLIDYLNPKGRAERNRIWKTIKYLEEKNRITLEVVGDDCFVRLTQYGRIKLDQNAVGDLTIRKPSYWDRKWRLVMFDIPSQYEKVRRPFREKLEDLGFKLYQRSVFIYPYECHQEVHTVAKWYGIDRYIRYVVAVEVHDMRTYVKIFDLA